MNEEYAGFILYKFYAVNYLRVTVLTIEFIIK